MPLTTPAMPTVSSGRRHGLPLSETPAATVRSMSVYSIGLDVAVGPAGAHEQAEIGRDLLLEVRADAAAAAILADRGDIGRAAGDLSQRDRVLDSCPCGRG